MDINFGNFQNNLLHEWKRQLEEQNVQQYGNPFGLQQPGYQGVTDASGKLLSQYSLASQPRGEFETMLRERALATGPSQLQQQQLQQQLGTFAQQQAGSQAQQLAQLSATGGVSGGLRERLAQAGQEQQQLGAQQIRSQALQQRLAEQQQLQGALAQQEGQIRQFDLQSMLADRNARNQFAQGNFQSQLGAMAALRSSQEQADAAAKIKNPKSGLFGLGIGGIL